MRELARVAVAAGFVLAACASRAPLPATPAAPVAGASTPVPSPGPDTVAEPAALPPGVPDTPAGHQLGWVMAAFSAPPDEATVAPRFAPSFASLVPPAEVVALFARFGPQLSPLAIDRVEDGATPNELAVVAHAEKPGGVGDPHDGPRVRLHIVVDATDAHLITGLTLRPVLDAAASWDGVQAGLRAVAPSVGFLAADLAGGKCTPISGIEPRKPVALGSAFKLYVLYALASQIASGKHGWDDPIVVEESKKSAPPGEMRKEPAGKKFTVREFAEKMIAASDNTATDHLLAFVGRNAVEDAVRASGHATPTRLVPFLSSRDLFAMKLLGSPDELQAYVSADVGHKRKLLEGFEQRDLSTTPIENNGWARPRMIDTIEWFASPEDLCKLMAALKAQADAPKTAAVGAILSVNPGIADEKGAYKYVGFKGGSEPGVMNMTWLLQRKSDDRWVFLTTGFNDPNAPVDEQKAVLAATVARDFLGK